LKNGSSQSLAISYIQSHYLLHREKKEHGEGEVVKTCVTGKGVERTNSNDNKKCSFHFFFLALWTDEPTMSSKLEEVYYEKAIFLFFVNYLTRFCKQNLCLRKGINVPHRLLSFYTP
jgi:hypothetical protein